MIKPEFESITHQNVTVYEFIISAKNSMKVKNYVTLFNSDIDQMQDIQIPGRITHIAPRGFEYTYFTGACMAAFPAITRSQRVDRKSMIKQNKL